MTQRRKSDRETLQEKKGSDSYTDLTESSPNDSSANYTITYQWKGYPLWIGKNFYAYPTDFGPLTSGTDAP